MTKPAVLVSGGSGGVGSAVCQLLSKEELQPIVGYHSNREVAHQIARETGGLAIELDHESKHSIDRTIEKIHGLPITLQGLVLCASPSPVVGSFTKITEKDMLHQWQVSVAGAQYLLAQVVKHFFRPKKSGLVVAVLTAAMGSKEKQAAANMGAYVIAKYGLRGLLKAAEAECPWLRCAEVLPDFIETGMLDVFDDRYLNMERAKRPLGRFSTTDEVAADIMYHILGGQF